jgi:predicted dehydrogenase
MEAGSRARPTRQLSPQPHAQVERRRAGRVGSGADDLDAIGTRRPLRNQVGSPHAQSTDGPDAAVSLRRQAADVAPVRAWSTVEQVVQEVLMKTVRWGVLSTAAIGMTKVTPAIKQAANADVVAIASRDTERARAAADALGVASAYGSYEALLESGEVDAVYLPLPNDLHAQWTVRAAQAGVHVLCEKPLAMSAAQAQQVLDACADAGVLLQEAFMYRHHPSWVEVMRLVREGRIGDVRAIQTWFSYYNDDPANIRNRPENGGGAVMDIGCYPINVARWLTGAEPSEVVSSVQWDPATGVDTLTSAVLTFPNGVQATFTVCIRCEDYQRVHVIGSHGRIEVEIPFNIPPDVSTRVYVAAGGNPPVDPSVQTLTFPPTDQYTRQAELFSQAILDGAAAPVHPSDAAGNMAVIERVLSPAADRTEPRPTRSRPAGRARGVSGADR